MRYEVDILCSAEISDTIRGSTVPELCFRFRPMALSLLQLDVTINLFVKVNIIADRAQRCPCPLERPVTKLMFYC